MRTSEKTTTLFKALLDVQRELKGFVVKDAENPFFKADYASMRSVIDKALPVLNEHDILVIQDAQTSKDGVGVTTLLHHVPSGEWLKTSPLFMPSLKKDPQGYGSAEAYARRYQLLPLLFLSPSEKEDDDGKAAAKESVNKRIDKKADDGLMTDAQRRKFFVLCNKQEMNAEENESFRGWLKTVKYQDPLTKDQASTIIEKFLAHIDEYQAWKVKSENE